MLTLELSTLPKLSLSLTLPARSRILSYPSRGSLTLSAFRQQQTRNKCARRPSRLNIDPSPCIQTNYAATRERNAFRGMPRSPSHTADMLRSPTRARTMCARTETACASLSAVRVCFVVARAAAACQFRCVRWAGASSASSWSCSWSSSSSMCSLRPAARFGFSVDETLSGDAEIPQRSAARVLVASRVERVVEWWCRVCMCATRVLSARAE